MKKPLLPLLLLSLFLPAQAQHAVFNGKVFLQGTMSAAADSMLARLIQNDAFPLTQPYSDAPWFYQGREKLMQKQPQIVDWLLVELRDARDVTFLESRHAAILLRNGQIVDTSLQHPLSFRELESGYYYVVLRHRNHLPIMSAQPILLSDTAFYDFSDSSHIQLWGGNDQALIKTATQSWAMIAGDVNQDMRLQYSGLGNDRSLVIQKILQGTGSSSITTTLSGYHNEDINMDSLVKYSGMNNDPAKIIQALIQLTGSTSITSIHSNPIPDEFHCGMPFIDPRDQKGYITMPIGEDCWMTENLNVGNMISSSSSATNNDTIEKYCYGDDSLQCQIKGGLYTWDEMMGYSQDAYNKGICPEGWHLPSDEEWYAMESWLDPMINNPDAFGWRGDHAGLDLQFGGPSGFQALLGGYRNPNGVDTGDNMLAKYWTSTKLASGQAIHRGLSVMNPGILRQSLHPGHALSVRCLRGEPLGIKPDIVLTDSSDVILLSDSTQLSQGLYIFEHIGPDSLQVNPGDIIIGGFPRPFLRKVIHIHQIGLSLVIQTEEATLEDVFEYADFESTLLTQDSTSTLSKVFVNRRIDYLAKGVSLNDAKGQLKYDFSNVVLYQQGPLSLKIDTGYFLLDPSFHFSFKYKKGAVRRIAFYTNNALLEHQIDIGMHVTSAYTLSDYNTTLATYSYDIVFFIGWVPVYIELKADLHAISKASFDAAFEATYGYKDQKYLTSGMIYENGDWRNIYDYQNNYEAHPLDWGGEVRFKQYAALVPKFSVKLYGVLGPYIEAIGYDSLLANVILPSLDWDAILKLGFKSNLGAEVTVFGKNLADYHKEIFAYETTLWEAPYEMSKISGDAQFARAGETLSETIKVKVIDKLNNTWLPVPVHFQVIEGGGSVGESVVYTGVNGYASTTWTLGNEIGAQSLEAIVRRADQSLISGSPQTFTAKAWYSGTGTQPCPGLPTISWFGQDYGTVKVGDQCWLNANMNMGLRLDASQSQSNNGNFEKFCYDDEPGNCWMLGGLYTWDEAMQYDTSEGSRGVCPPGWHIPSDNDWKILEGNLDSLYPVGDAVWDQLGFRGSNAGRMMRSVALWPGNANDTDRVFNGLPAGKYSAAFSGLEQEANFWTSNQGGSGSALSRKLRYEDERSFRHEELNSQAFSVRCLQDSACYPPPDQANAGADQDSVPGGFLHLSANMPVNGSGSWTIHQGTGGSLSSPGSPTSGFSGDYGSTYSLVWTITNYCGATTDTVLIHFDSYMFSCGDSITDSRDQRRYSTVAIGSHCWMGENLNYGSMVSASANQANNGIPEKYCYNNQEAGCTQWGAFYQWGEAMNYSIAQSARGLCPEGWHIPNDSTWIDLEGNVDSYYGPGDPIWWHTYYRGTDAGYRMKSTTGWTGTGANGNNASGFKAIPAGWRIHAATPPYYFVTIGLAANFWTSSSYYYQMAHQGYYRQLVSGGGLIDPNKVKRDYASPQGNGFSLRCVRD